LVCWIRTAVPRRTTAALVAASGEEGCRPAPETLLDSGSWSWTDGAVSRGGRTKLAAPATALRGARGTCGSRLAAAVSQGTETHTFCHRPQCRSGACQRTGALFVLRQTRTSAMADQPTELAARS